MKKEMKPAYFIAQAAIIAALYVVITYFVAAFNLASGAIQVRISEALTILPVFTPAAIPGLFIGCLLANTLTGAVIWDIIFGSLATLIATIGTYLLRKTKFLYTLPPVLSNAIIVPLVLQKAYGLGDAYWFLFLTVGLGEVISVCVLGFLLKNALSRYAKVLFEQNADSVKKEEREDVKNMTKEA
jgi:uncharacterized membrane protein